MKLISYHVTATRGANQQPIAGEATFDDGSSYGFSISDEGDILFIVESRQSYRSFGFAAPKRAAALRTVLDL